MTVFGIALYTLVSIFIWPVRSKDRTLDIAQRLFSFQAELYENRDAKAETRSTLYQKLQSQEKALEEAVINTGTDNAELSKVQRATVLHNAREINKLLLLLSYHGEVHYSDKYHEFVNNFTQADREIKTLLKSLQYALQEKKEIDIPDAWKAAYNTEAIKQLSHLDRAALISTIHDIRALHDALRAFAQKINAVLSPYPTRFPLNEENAPSAFYFIPGKISIFFLLGMAILGLSNPMVYNFQIFLMILFVFYLFLFVLMLFYYIPFSTKPERLFLTMKERFFRLSADLLQQSNRLSENRGTLLGSIKAGYARKQLIPTVRKMQLWASKIDTAYFHEIDKAHLAAFGKACETFAYLLQMMVRQERKAKGNPLIQALKEAHRELSLATLLENYANGAKVTEVKEQSEESFKNFFNHTTPEKYSEAEIIAFYENISLRRNVWVSMMRCRKEIESLDFRALEKSRF